ncbi:MAG: hypothetical protein KDA85_22395, partial [Planctomycetaceae bacterium]|nr:hypothetical protein [Planctomycetaceae bacterium]
LAPDGRVIALKKLKPKVQAEWVDAVRHALGGNVQRIGNTAELWAAAARARSPRREDPVVQKAFPQLGPGAGLPTDFEIQLQHRKHGGKSHLETKVRWADGSAPTPNPRIPTQLLQTDRAAGNSLCFVDLGIKPGSIQWLASLWPAAQDSFFAAGAQSLMDNLDWWEAAWHHRSFLEPLLDSDTPLRSIGQFLLLCGLAAKEPGEHGLAVDIAIQAIRDGRLGTDNLSAVLSSHVPAGLFNFTRLSKRCRDIAAVSPLHATVIFVAWEKCLAEGIATMDPNAEVPRGFGDILEMLLEIGTELQQGIRNPGAVEYLRRIKGSGKTNKLARQLLRLTSTSTATDSLELAISSRLDLLQAWQQRG